MKMSVQVLSTKFRPESSAGADVKSHMAQGCDLLVDSIRNRHTIYNMDRHPYEETHMQDSMVGLFCAAAELVRSVHGAY